MSSYFSFGMAMACISSTLSPIQHDCWVNLCD
jgi:hypothetical protein